MLPIHGEHLYTSATITFQESYTGTVCTFSVEEPTTCLSCGGRGSVQSQPCSSCNTTGTIRSLRRVEVHIPAGVDTDVSVRLAGEGKPGIYGGVPGDFFVKITVTPDPAFGRDGTDLYISAKVPQNVATYGGQIPVRMPDGSTYTVNAPGNLKDGIRIRVANTGIPIPHSSRRGNLYVVVKIVPHMTVPHSPKKVPAKRAQPKREKKQVAVPPPLATSSSQAPRINAVLGNYRLLRVLGSGGFADVFLGEHIHLQTQAAIKILRESIRSEDTQEFLQEAKFIASLRHSNIVRVLDFGMEPGTTLPYLVMDYVSGGTLLDRHPEGTRLSLETILSYLKQIAAALDYAHTQKVVHRDVKPANLLVEVDHILLSDFGIAVAAHTAQSLVTQSAIGTVTYMAPEQIRKKPRPASDQYALAVIVYEWLSGTPPFTGDPIEVAMSHLSDTPASLAWSAGISLEVEQVVFRALHKDADQRFPTVQVFVDALEQAGMTA